MGSYDNTNKKYYAGIQEMANVVGVMADNHLAETGVYRAVREGFEEMKDDSAIFFARLRLDTAGKYSKEQLDAVEQFLRQTIERDVSQGRIIKDAIRKDRVNVAALMISLAEDPDNLEKAALAALGKWEAGLFAKTMVTKTPERQR